VYLKACHIENYEECNNALLSVTRSWTTCRWSFGSVHCEVIDKILVPKSVDLWNKCWCSVSRHKTVLSLRTQNWEVSINAYKLLRKMSVREMLLFCSLLRRGRLRFQPLGFSLAQRLFKFNARAVYPKNIRHSGNWWKRGSKWTTEKITLICPFFPLIPGFSTVYFSLYDIKS
jgi:hypothetical protein